MFVELEQALVQRLKSNLDKIAVLTAAELSDVTEDRQPTPAVHIIYQGYQPQEVRHDGRVARVELQWLIVVATKDVRSMRSGRDSRLSAGELVNQVLPLLMGWHPAQASSPLKLASAPRPVYSAGITYLPLAFSVETTIKVTQ